MSPNVTWLEIAVRLALTILAGSVIGLDRGEHGHPAGLRTTLLVCLAASIAMIQVNLLLAMNGRSPASFVMLDLMRLPLGILSGMGFIGAGAIVRRDGELVKGVTTAATLWFVTVLGLCFGGGQLRLGVSGLVLGMGILWGLKYVERAIPQVRRATLRIAIGAGGPDEEAIARDLSTAGYEVGSWAVAYSDGASRLDLTCVVRWRGRPDECLRRPLPRDLARRPGVIRVAWEP